MSTSVPSTPRQLPRHKRIKNWVVNRIEDGSFFDGEQLPTERELMETHRVSRGTLRRAMDELEIEGRIERLPGKGTFVRVPAIESEAVRRWFLLVRYEQNTRDNIVAGVEEYASLVGAELVVEYVGDSADSLERAAERITGTEESGVILEPLPYEPRAESVYGKLLEAGVPLVFITTPECEVDAPVVSLDFVLVGEEIVDHLTALGHRRIGFVSSPRHRPVDELLEGYRRALDRAGIVPNEEWVHLEPVLSEARGFEATRELLRLAEPPTALIALNSQTAANVYRALKVAGLRIPHNISVVAGTGSNDVMARALDPPLTVWAPQRCGLRRGRAAAEVLFAYHGIRWPDAGRKEIRWEPAPLAGGSVGLAPED